MTHRLCDADKARSVSGFKQDEGQNNKKIDIESFISQKHKLVQQQVEETVKN